VNSTQPSHGVLLGRADGVIVLADAIPWPTEVQQQLNDVLDALGAPRTQLRATDSRDTQAGRPDD
jgi:hypothetical protein